ncbi:hypothetical protein WA158_005588 [Blastocystis sp. Blastoise]
MFNPFKITSEEEEQEKDQKKNQKPLTQEELNALREKKFKAQYEQIQNYRIPEPVIEEKPVEPRKVLTVEEKLLIEKKKKQLSIHNFIASMFTTSEVPFNDSTCYSVDNFIPTYIYYVEKSRGPLSPFIYTCKCYATLLNKKNTLKEEYMISVYTYCKLLLEGALYSCLFGDVIFQINEISISKEILSLYEYHDISVYSHEILISINNHAMQYNTCKSIVNVLLQYTQINAKQYYRDANLTGMQMCYQVLFDIIQAFPSTFDVLKEYLDKDIKIEDGFILQRTSYFSPFFSLHPADPSVAIVLFRGNVADNLGRVDIANHTKQVMNELDAFQNNLFQVFKCLLRSSVTKDSLLTWIEKVIYINSDYLKMKYSRAKLSSFGFLLTLSTFLYKIVEPLQKNPSLIDLNYLTSSSNLLTNEDRILFEYKPSDPSLDSSSFKAATKYYFYFSFLFSRCHVPLYELLENVERSLRSMLPNGFEGLSNANETLMNQINSTFIMSQAISSFILSSTTIYMYMNYTQLTIQLILKASNSTDIHNLCFSPTELFNAIPLRLLSQIVHSNKCILMNIHSLRSPIIPAPSYYSLLLAFLTLSLDQKIQIHIQADLGECLYTTFIPSESTLTAASTQLLSSPLLPKQIIPAVIRLYGDVGQIGDMSISHRRGLAQFLREIWNMKGYHEEINNLEDNKEIIINFAFGLISTFSNLIAETFSDIPTIKSMYKDHSSPQWSQLSQEERDDQLLNLKRLENRVRSSFSLANEALKLFRDTAEEWHEIWMDDKLRDNLASSLANILKQLVGKEGAELKLQDPSQYNFDPNEFLSLLLHVILCFYKDSQFAISILNSGQQLANSFIKAESISRRKNLLDSVELSLLHTFINTLKKESLVVQDIYALIDEAPDEFIDIISGDIMRDPVQLPLTHQVVDRTTIEHALLTSPVNPFNKQPLTKEQLIPQPELKAKIDNWLKEHNAL